MRIEEALDMDPPVDTAWLADVEAAIAAGDGVPVRALCLELAAGLPLQRIERRGQPYLDRYLVADLGRRRGRVLLHHFVAGDEAGLLHSHPWDESRSAILAGGYLEHRYGAPAAELRPGAANVLRSADFHRVELIETDCWTLFSAGAPCQTWHFLDPDTRRRIHHTRAHR